MRSSPSHSGIESKNSLRENFNMKYKSFYKNRTGKNSKKLIHRSFMSEHRDFYSMKKREDLSLTSRDNKNNRLNSKIRKRPFKSKSKRENSS